MKYRQLVKTVDTSDYHEGTISPGKVKAQYNPERFHLWKSLHKGPEKEALNMIYSPHYRFLKNRKDKSYRQLQRLYGRNNRWIDDKIKKFLGVFESIKNEGFKESIMIVERSLVTNKYNDGFEIFEGHHRIACALVLNIKEIPCQIIKVT
jgi:hypothetical protein